MIYLFTGAPGTFKTYSAIAFAKELAGDSRRVYVSGVTDLKVPGWQQLDRDGVRDWKQQLPDGAILLCDEVSDLVPQRIKGDVPDWVNDLRTHRHKGLDLIFVTQHPMDVDVVFRRLVGEHRHFFRQFGIRRVSFLRGDSVRWSSVDKLIKRFSLSIGLRSSTHTRFGSLARCYMGSCSSQLRACSRGG